MRPISFNLLDLLKGKSEREEISAVRQGILNNLLRLVSLVSLPAVGIGAGQALFQGRWVFSLLYVSIYLLFLTALFGFRRLPYRAKAMILVGCLFAISLAVLVRLGISGQGIFLMVGVCFMASVFFGVQVGISALAVCLVSIGTVGTAMTTGWIKIYPDQMLTSLSAMAWVIALLVFFMIVAMMVTVPELFVRNMESSLDLLEQHKDRLEVINQKLRDEIQERERAEEVLKKNEKKYRSVIENIQDVFYRTDAEGRLILCSPSGARMFGYNSVDEMIGLPIGTMWPDAVAHRTFCETINTNGAVRDFEAVLKRKDGAAFNASLTTHIYYDDENHALGTEGLVRNITEWKKAEEAVRESEEKFRNLVETSSDWIWETDTDARYTYASPKVAELLGYAPEEVVGRTIFDFMLEEDTVGAQRRWPIFCAAKRPWHNYENINLHKDGRHIVLETSAVPILDHAGNLVGYRGINRDVTERKFAEEEARRLRNYLKNIIDSMPSILVGVDVEGRVVQWNLAAERATGTCADDARDQMLHKVMPQLNRQLERVKDAMAGKTVKSQIKVPRHAHGETLYDDITVYPLIANGVEGAVIRVDDVTERVRMEEMLIQSEKMLSVGGLAAGMAHEINNPLGVILQASQNILRRVSPDLPANARAAASCGISLKAVSTYLENREIFQFLEDIRKSGERASDIVSNMLSFSRRADTEGRSTDLRELLDRTLALAASDYDLKRRYDFRQIEIVKEYDPDVPMVVCKSGKIQQVILNILRNGAEAMYEQRARQEAEGGNAYLARFILRVMRDKGMVRMEISDNGPGMKETTRKRVFEPFFTTKAPGVGTGLGLSVSYFIITEEHEGTLSVESSPGAGTTFTLRLPSGGKKQGMMSDTEGYGLPALISGGPDSREERPRILSI